MCPPDQGVPSNLSGPTPPCRTRSLMARLLFPPRSHTPPLWPTPRASGLWDVLPVFLGELLRPGGPPQSRPRDQRGSQYKAGKGVALFQKVVNEQGLARRSGSPTPGGDRAGEGTRRGLGGSRPSWACRHKCQCAQTDAGSRARVCKIEGASLSWAKPVGCCLLASLPGSVRDSPRCAAAGRGPRCPPSQHRSPPCLHPQGRRASCDPEAGWPALLRLGHAASVERNPEFLPHPRDHLGVSPSAHTSHGGLRFLSLSYLSLSPVSH